MTEMKTEMISLFVWDGMTLEDMCNCDRLLNEYGVRIDWDSMEDMVDGYTVDAEWEHTPEFGRGKLMSTIQCEFDGAIRLRWDDE